VTIRVYESDVEGRRVRSRPYFAWLDEVKKCVQCEVGGADACKSELPGIKNSGKFSYKQYRDKTQLSIPLTKNNRGADSIGRAHAAPLRGVTQYISLPAMI